MTTYSATEIHAMREAVVVELCKEARLEPGGLNPNNVEDRLRTYILAGVTSADLPTNKDLGK